MNNTLVNYAGNLPALQIVSGDVKTVMQTLQTLSVCYRDISIANAQETTQRVAIREQAKVLISKFHEETERYRIDRTCQTTTQLEFIRALNEVLCAKDMLDENTYKLLIATMERVFPSFHL